MAYIDNILNKSQKTDLISVSEYIDANNAKNVVLYGTGLMGRSALACLRRIGFDVVAFSESNKSKWDTVIDGLEVIAPCEISKRIKDPFVIICFNHNLKSEVPQVVEALKSEGCCNIVFYGDLFVIEELQLLGNPIAFSRAIIPKTQHHGEIKRLFALLADDKSKSTLIQVLHDRIHPLSESNDQWEIPSEQMYFPEDLYQLNGCDNFIDCGAFDGDTLRSYWSRVKLSWEGRYYAFEPDMRNFQKFCATVDSLDIEGKEKINYIPKAVGRKSGEIRFEETGYAGGSHLSPEGNSVVECVALDDLYDKGEISASIIKMDIEGGEKDALLGAKEMIGQCRPTLAISIYHFPNDLWEIPLAIADDFPFYKLFIRAYTAGDIVCYAVQKKI
jgi:FkbM family methyltransferase